MAAHKYIDRICALAAALSLLLTLLFLNGEALGIQPAAQALGYETKLFDTSRVHTIDIVMDDWEGFLDGCEDEEYVPCAVVIDNEAYKNVGIRAKGNTSLSTVSQLGSDRYSFKLEFDHYEAGKSFYGLDKLCLNNLIQDNTMMKDYLTYRLMAQFGVAAPLCSYVWITVNCQDWGLYLAVEGVEDAFLRRNYGQDAGALYKPDSMDFGGGRGNGRDFDMGDFDPERFQPEERGEPSGRPKPAGSPGGNEPGNLEPPNGTDAQTSVTPAGGLDPPSNPGRAQDGSRPSGNFPGNEGGIPEDFPGNEGGIPEDFPGNEGGIPDGFQPSGGFPGDMGGGMGSDDVKLKYIDDDPDSYPNLFDSAKTTVTDGDKARLIQSLKALGEGGDVSKAVDIDQVLRYFVVHNYVVNGDSYTGSMVHNYYLYEKDGRLSLIPWDYNLAFGTFQGNDASGAVNDPIDSPLSVTGDGDRPMADWIFSSEEYTTLYHQYFAEFIASADPAALIKQAQALIAPYVERDPTKFCTTEEFQAGAAALETFCALRRSSVSGQLAGSIPSTGSGQKADSAALVDTSGLNLSDLGTMGQGGSPGAAPGQEAGGGLAFPGRQDSGQLAGAPLEQPRQ